MRRGRFRPFTGDTASRVNLEKNALALVLCQVRSGYVPPEQTVDPMIPPVAGNSWVLDLDSFKQKETVVDPGTVVAVVQKLADISYDYFKHAVTDAFLELHGGGGS